MAPWGWPGHPEGPLFGLRWPFGHPLGPVGGGRSTPKATFMS